MRATTASRTYCATLTPLRRASTCNSLKSSGPKRTSVARIRRPFSVVAMYAIVHPMETAIGSDIVEGVGYYGAGSVGNAVARGDHGAGAPRRRPGRHRGRAARLLLIGGRGRALGPVAVRVGRGRAAGALRPVDG